MQQKPIVKNDLSISVGPLKVIADQMANRAYLAAEKVVMNPNLKPVEGNYEAIFADRFRALPYYLQDQYRAKFERYYKINPVYRKMEFGSVLPEIVEGREVDESTKDVLFPERAEAMSENQIITEVYSLLGLNMEPVKKKSAVHKKLDLYVKKIKCVDETGRGFWGELGDDEIYLSGILVSCSGESQKISFRKVGNFNDGDVKNVKWLWRRFDLADGGDQWPKIFIATFILAEKYLGGMSSFLNKLYDKVHEDLEKYLAQLIGKSLTPRLGAVLGPVVGVIVADIIDKVLGKIIGATQDDIFRRPRTAILALPDEDANFTIRFMNRTIPMEWSNSYRLDFKDHNGHYDLDYQWHLYQHKVSENDSGANSGTGSGGTAGGGGGMILTNKQNKIKQLEA